MTRNARNRFVAWLGIAAMWLAIVAPVISQTLAARQAADDPQALLCAVDAAATDEHDAHAVHAAPEQQASHHDGASHFDACSYCGLLAHNLPLPTVAAFDVARIERVTRVAAFAPRDVIVSKSFNAARPRAPPAFS